MQIIERKAAKAVGLVHYFTGRPCKRGHITTRFTGSGKCTECNTLSVAANGEYFHQYHIDNQDKKIAAAKKWAKDNPVENLARIAKWQRDNPDKVCATQRRWRHRNLELAAERVADWEKKNPLKRKDYTNRRRSLLVCGTAEPISPQELIALRESQKDLCAYCNDPLNGSGHLDHKTPISRGGMHTLSNVHWTCGPCNWSKGPKTDEEYRVYRLECDLVDKRSIRAGSRPRTKVANSK